jgi:hypothetical protein
MVYAIIKPSVAVNRSRRGGLRHRSIEALRSRDEAQQDAAG